jgi:hypothetical protein
LFGRAEQSRPNNPSEQSEISLRMNKNKSYISAAQLSRSVKININKSSQRLRGY